MTIYKQKSILYEPRFIKSTKKENIWILNFTKHIWNSRRGLDSTIFIDDWSPLEAIWAKTIQIIEIFVFKNSTKHAQSAIVGNQPIFSSERGYIALRVWAPLFDFFINEIIRIQSLSVKNYLPQGLSLKSKMQKWKLIFSLSHIQVPIDLRSIAGNHN